MTRIQMKRILISTVTLGLAAFAGCVNLDEKLITGVSSEYYSTPDGLNSAVVASYSQLRSYYGREQLISLAQAGPTPGRMPTRRGRTTANSVPTREA